jgi:hypothetical protein
MNVKFDILDNRQTYAKQMSDCFEFEKTNIMILIGNFLNFYTAVKYSNFF